MTKVTDHVIDARIYWWEGCANSPNLYILLDDDVSIPRIEDYRYEIKDGTIFFAEKDGFVSYGAYNFKRNVNEGGYCGYEWNIALLDGTTKRVRGGWSSRSGVMNAMGFPHSMEVVLNQGTWDPSWSGMACSVTIEVVKNVMTRFLLSEASLILENDDDDGDVVYRIICKDGRKKPSWPVNPELLENVVLT